MPVRTEDEAALRQAAAVEKAVTAEHRIAVVRLLVVLFNGITYAAVYGQMGTPVLAWPVFAIALVYSVGVVALRPYLRFPVMATSSFTTWTDGALITIWLIGTGGIASPYYLLWFLSLVAVTFRYDEGGPIRVAVLYPTLYVGLVAAMGQLPEAWKPLLTRCAYLLLTGALATLMARDAATRIRKSVALQQQLQHIQQFEALSDATKEGVCIHRDGVVLAVNRSFCELMGRNREKLVGEHVLKLIAPDSLPRVAQRLEKPDDAPYTIGIKRPDGTELDVEVEARDIVFEGAPCRVVAVRDLSRENELIEQRIERELQEAELSRLQEVNHFKSEFINTAAHELNTPLTPIRLQLHMLRSYKHDQLGPEERRSLAMLDRNLSRLGGLVRDMLDVARMQSGRLEMRLDDVAVDEVALHVAQTFGAAATERELQLFTDLEAKCTIEADRDRFEQVLVNLVSNALKFTPPGGSVRIQTERFDGGARITVRDTGAGLTADQQGALFQPFTQMHHRDIAGGTGLGLYICKSIVERHGGSIAVESDGPGTGTRFVVDMPSRVPPLLDVGRA